MTPERRAEIQAARQAREAEAEAREQAHADLLEELDDQFSRKLGIRGVDWALINADNDCNAGPIVLKLGDITQYKAWQAKPGQAVEDMFAYVAPNVVFPEKTVFNEIANRRPELLKRAVVAQNRLFGDSEANFRGKV
jgi:hypothetical protein